MSEFYNFPKYEIKSIKDFVGILSTIPDYFIFRGHSDASRGLTSTLERSIENLNLQEFEKENIEKEMLDKFKRLAIGTLSNLPPLTNDLEWTALLQHHGGYTRLLDFTKSFPVAVFFAVMSLSGEDACIWAIDKRSLNNCAILRITELLDDEEDEINRFINKMHPHTDPLFLGKLERMTAEYIIKNKPNKRGFITVEPQYLNPRLVAQQGLFILPFNLSNSLMENLSYSIGHILNGTKENPKDLSNIDEIIKETKFIKIIIPSQFHKDILNLLLKMNITPATLFPGLDGLARTMNYHRYFLRELKK